VDPDKKLSWSCTSVGFYRQKPAGDIAFSEDGSVLAVAFKDVITLWDPEYNSMHQDVVSLASSDVTVRYDSKLASLYITYLMMCLLVTPSVFDLHDLLDLMPRWRAQSLRLSAA